MKALTPLFCSLTLSLFGLMGCSGQSVILAPEGPLLPTPLPTPSILTGSGTSATQPAPPPAAAPKAETLNLNIPFSSTALGLDPASTLTLNVFNCSNTTPPSHPALKNCAPDAKPVYRAELPVQSLSDPLSIPLTGLKVGDTLEFSASGHDRGNCNQITAGPQGITLSASPLLWRELKWQSTDRNCQLKLTVSGKVTDASQQPLALVQIEARSRDSSVVYSQKTETLVDGSYRLQEVPQGIPIEIRLSKRGYLTQTLNASFVPTNVNQAEIKELNFALSDPN